MRFHRRLISLLAALFVAATVGVVAAPAQAVTTSGPWIIETYISGPGSGGPLDGCLIGKTPTKSAVIQQSYCYASFSWHMTEVTSGVWELKEDLSGLCMNVKGASTVKDALVIEYPCGAASQNDRWRLQKQFNQAGLDWYYIRNVHSNMCLNVSGAASSPSAFANMIQYPCGVKKGNDLFTWGPA